MITKINFSLHVWLGKILAIPTQDYRTDQQQVYEANTKLVLAEHITHMIN